MDTDYINTKAELIIKFSQLFNDTKEMNLKNIILSLPSLVIQVEKVGKSKKLNGSEKYALLECVLRGFVNCIVTDTALKDEILTFIVNDLNTTITTLVYIANNSKEFKKVKKFLSCKK